MTATEKGHITEWPQSLVWALFDTYYGAEEALKGLQGAHNAWLVTIENAAVVSKNKDGVVAFNETRDRSGAQGLGTGALIGGVVGLVFPPALLAATAAGAAAGGLGARARDAGFEDNALRGIANQLERDQSVLLAVVTHHWLDDVVAFLDRTAYRVGWTEVSEQVGHLLESHDGAP